VCEANEKPTTDNRQPAIREPRGFLTFHVPGCQLSVFNLKLPSALVGTRVVYDYMTSRRELKHLSI
jgi:hypothetical protein